MWAPINEFKACLVLKSTFQQNIQPKNLMKRARKYKYSKQYIATVKINLKVLRHKNKHQM